MKKTGTRYLILDDIRSIYNVGSIFRTADAAGIEKIYLCGYTPSPIDRFGRKRTGFTKVSLGAEDSVAWESVSDIHTLLKKFKEEGVSIVAVEQSPKSISYKEIPDTFPQAFIFGNETEGIGKEVLKEVDCIAEIPMHGAKESLNVSVAVGIMLFS